MASCDETNNLNRTGHIQTCQQGTVGSQSRNLRSCSIFWLTNSGWTVVLIFWLKSLSWARTISAEAWSLNGRTTRMGSDRSLTVGEETGWSDTLAVTNCEMVELTSLSGYFFQMLVLCCDLKFAKPKHVSSIDVKASFGKVYSEFRATFTGRIYSTVGGTELYSPRGH